MIGTIWLIANADVFLVLFTMFLVSFITCLCQSNKEIFMKIPVNENQTRLKSFSLH